MRNGGPGASLRTFVTTSGCLSHLDHRSVVGPLARSNATQAVCRLARVEHRCYGSSTPLLLAGAKVVNTRRSNDTVALRSGLQKSFSWLAPEAKDDEPSTSEEGTSRRYTPIRQYRWSQKALPSRALSSNDGYEAEWWIHNPWLDRLHEQLDRRRQLPDAELIWQLFEDIKAKGLLAKLPSRPLVACARRLCDRMYSGCSDFAELQSRFGHYGERLNSILHVLELRKPLVNDIFITYTSVRLIADLLLNNFDNAEKIARQMSAYHQLASDVFCIRTISFYVEAIQQIKSSSDAVDSLRDVWGLSWPHLYNSQRGQMPHESRVEGDKYRKLVQQIMSDIPIPMLWIHERLPSRDAQQMSNAIEMWIRYLNTKQRSLEAYEIMREFKGVRARDGGKIFFRDVTYDITIRALVREDEMKAAQTLFNELPSDGRQHKHHFRTGLMLSAATGDIQGASRYFELQKSEGEVTDTDTQLLLHACSVANDINALLDLWYTFHPPEDTKHISILHFHIIIHAYAKRGDNAKVEKWLQEMSRHGHELSLEICKSLFKMYALRMDLDATSNLLDLMHKRRLRPDKMCYTSILSLLANRKDPVAAERLVRSVERQGIVPDRHMLNTLMHAHVKADSWEGVVKIFDYLVAERRRSKKPYTIDIFNILLGAFVRIGAPFTVVAEYWRKLGKIDVTPSEHTWALLTQSACDAKRMDIADEIFREMDQLGEGSGQKSSINAYILSIIMSGHLRSGDREGAKRVFDEMSRRNLQPLSGAYARIVRMYANQRAEEGLQQAEEFIQGLKEESDKADTQPAWLRPGGGIKDPWEVVYMPLMAAYKNAFRIDDVERIFKTLLEYNGDPTTSFYTILMDAYRRIGDIETIRNLWQEIMKRARAESTGMLLLPGENNTTDSSLTQRPHASKLCVPLSIYIKALSHAGMHIEIAEAWTEVRKAGFAFDPDNWNHLAVALVRAGEVERAFEVVERVIMPAAKRFQALVQERDTHPDNVFVFDATDLAQTELLVNDSALQNAQRRRAQQEKTQGKLLESDLAVTPSRTAKVDDDELDFAHPLHIISQLAPAWGVWRPQIPTLAHLGWSLGILERGELIHPWSSIHRTNEQAYSPLDALQRHKTSDETDQAHELLQRLRGEYSHTCDMLEQWRHSFEAVSRIRAVHQTAQQAKLPL